MTSGTDKPGGSPEAREAAIRALDSRFRRPLLAYFQRRGATPAEAQDLTQDVFVRLIGLLQTSQIRNAEALVFRISANLARSRARQLRRHGIEEPLTCENILEFADAFAVDLSPERVVLGERTLADVLGALQELGERTRGIFLLYRFENLRIKEIADFYGISASAVEKHVGKALLHLGRCKEPK